MDDKKYLTVKDWANEDKPREKMLHQGKKSLSNAELIAILLRSGVSGKSVVELAREVLRTADNSLVTLAQMEFSQLRSVKGMAEAKATSLMAALELGWRMQSESNSRDKVINDSSSAFNYMLPVMVDLDHEEFWAVYTNNRGKVLARQRISIGGRTATQADLRIIFRAALECKAVRLIVAHNHPSGKLKPSIEDKRLTQQIAEAGNILEIKLVDHLIIGITPDGRPDYYSFNDNGLV